MDTLQTWHLLYQSMCALIVSKQFTFPIFNNTKTYLLFASILLIGKIDNQHTYVIDSNKYVYCNYFDFRKKINQICLFYKFFITIFRWFGGKSSWLPCTKSHVWFITMTNFRQQLRLSSLWNETNQILQIYQNRLSFFWQLKNKRCYYNLISTDAFSAYP